MFCKPCSLRGGRVVSVFADEIRERKMKALSLATLISDCGPVIAVQVTSYQVGGQKAAETRLHDPFVSLDGSWEFWTSCDTCPACVPLCDFLGRRGQGFCHILKDFCHPRKVEICCMQRSSLWWLQGAGSSRWGTG